MDNFEIRETGTEGEVVMSGTLTIENASAVRDGILAAFAKTDRIVIALDEDIAVDLAFLQILCSACHTAASAGKIFALKEGRPGRLSEAAAAAGYLRKRCCSRGKSCLWITKEEE
jgi:anti-anti-sigma regulatory factor